MKYLFITLTVQDGENRHTHRILHTTPGEDINFAAQRYAATFYGDVPERTNTWWFFFSGTIAVEVERVTELTEYEYKLMSLIFSGDKRRNDYFQIERAGFYPNMDREEIQIHCGENGNLFIVKTDEGFVVDVYNQDDNVNTMTVWEDDLTPMPDEDDFDPNNVSSLEIDVFVNTWGQKHGELCANLGYSKKTSDDIIMLDYFWYSKTKVWIPKISSQYSTYQQAMADYLRSKQ